jgi:hypothetical protein
MAINYLIEEDEAWGHKRRHSSKRSFGSVRGGGIWLTGAGPYEFIHDHTQSLTSHLDKIGMPTVKEVRPDYDKLSPVFAYKFYNLALEAAVMWEKSEPL